MPYQLSATSIVDGMLRIMAPRAPQPDVQSYLISAITSAASERDSGREAGVNKYRPSSSIALSGARNGAQFASIGALTDGWNGEGSLAPSTETLESVGRLIRQLPSELSSPEFTPNDNGTISIEWENTRGYVHLEVGTTRFAMTAAAAQFAPRFYNGSTAALDVDFVAERASGVLFQTRREYGDVTLSRFVDSFALQSA
ncbi:hypothetical protein ACRAWC_09330 [Leifsonia sp. L25]|uniref:hypothetical protein n=1 Tax=Actinomycetes TaxID=1760 RepID=UPI003D681BA6